MPEATPANAIIADLYGRSGFDAWWEEIPPDVQQEIREEIASHVTAAGAETLRVVRGALDRTYSPQIGRCRCDLHPVDVFDRAVEERPSHA